MSDGCTLVTADWVVPIASPPVERGGVLVEGSRVVQVGSADALRQTAPDARERCFLGGIVIPGLVNAHTHLSLTVLEGTAPPSAFPEWLDTVVPRILAMDPPIIAASAATGVRRMLAAGITAVGDVTYRDESVAPAAEAGLAGVFFREVLGKAGDEVVGFLDETGFPPDTPDPRTRIGLSAHSPYSTGPDAICETVRIARETGLPFMMHVAESPAEEALLLRGEGRLANLAGRLAPDFDPPGVGTVTYLDGLGVLDGMIAVHAIRVDDTEIALLAEKARGVVLCPRSNTYLEFGAPPVRAYVDAGVPLALGTDSIASNRSFDLFEEARALREIDPRLTSERTLRIMTAEGASVVGLEGHGSLAPGSPADLVAIALDATDDPVRDVVGVARVRDITAVMTAGVWRV